MTNDFLHFSHFSDLRVVAVGGGTGLSTMLRGVKLYTQNINVIVTVADDGGNSGMIREDLHILPPGDIRNCLTALADTEPIMRDLFRYRFTSGRLEGYCFGNLFLAAMSELSGSFEKAIEKMSSVLAVTGNVLPVTCDNVNLKAELENGTVVYGECSIPKCVLKNKSPIKKIMLSPQNVKVNDKCINAIYNADLIVLGPGSLYTSIIPNLIVDGMKDALKNTNAKIVYVCNVMTQPGETDGFTAYSHIKAIENHLGENIVDFCVANSQKVPDIFKKRYEMQSAFPVIADDGEFTGTKTKLIQKDLLYFDGDVVRHDYIKLAETLLLLPG